MPIESAEAVVLRTERLGEQDKLVVLFSRDRGVLRGVAKGARKFGNRFGSSLEPLSLVRVHYYERERRELVTISGCDLLESFFEVQTNPRGAALLAYFAELVEAFAPPRTREDLLYRLLLSTLRAAAAGGDPAALARYFEAWCLRIAGVLPDMGRCRACRKALETGWLSPKRDGAYCGECAPLMKDDVPPEFDAFLAWVRTNPPPGPAGTPFSPEQIRRFGRLLKLMIAFQLEREPKSLRAFED